MRTLLSLPLLLLASCEQDYEVVAKPVDVNPGDITECGFTRVEDTAFYQYDCNPVFTTTGEDWAANVGGTTFLVTEVLNHPFYQLWYTGSPDNSGTDFSLGYAVSPDGTEWTPYQGNPLLDAPEPSEWDADAMDGMQVVWDPNTDQYVMLYQGYNLGGDTPWGLGVAISPDGRDWRRIGANPVVDLQDPDSRVHYCWPLGLTLGDVAGFTGYVAGALGERNDNCEVYRINASSVSDWQPDDDVVYPAGPNGEWDDEGYSSLAIAELDGSRHMFYVGFGEWLDHPTEQGVIIANHAYLGMATNEDGEWVRDGAIIPVNMTESGEVSAVAARTVGSRIHLWITDNYDGASAVGYFLYDPEAAAAEDGGGGGGETE